MIILSFFLTQALQEEGKNPDEIVFDISDKKIQTPRKGNGKIFSSEVLFLE